MKSIFSPRVVGTACMALLLGACAGTAAPPATYDGLVLVPKSRFGVVYRRPGAEFSGYEAYGLVPCQVAFRKNWTRDQNRSTLDLSSRVTQKDVAGIKDNISAECDKYFSLALERSPPYPLVQSFSDGERVLILRPAIVNLDISAPDMMSSSMKRVYTTEAGEMTLVLEVLDGTTGEILVRVIDRQVGGDMNRLQWSNSVTNSAEGRRILSRWADKLREGLDEVTATSAPTHQ